MIEKYLNEPPERKEGWPDGEDDVINKYGTYEVQRTNGMENEYPQIAQWLASVEAESMQEAAQRWKRRKPNNS